MSRIHRAFALASALSLLPALARADDPYADFRVPDHRTFTWIVQSSGGINSSQENASSRSRERSLNGHLLSRMAWGSETEARLRALAVATDARWISTRDQFDAHFPFNETDHEVQHRRNDAQSLTVSGGQRSYLGRSSFAVDAQASAALELAQRGSSQDRRDLNITPSSNVFEFTSNEDFEDRRYQQSGSASLGLGFGRVRDVTGVFSAQLIEQRLRATGRLTRALSPEAALRLAQLHYVANDITAAHDRPGRYFWREVERVLREDGALNEGTLDAYSLERVLEPALGVVQITRRVGIFVRPFYFGSESSGHLDEDFSRSTRQLDDGVPVFSDSEKFSRRIRVREKDSGVGLGVEVHRPAGMRWQSDLSVAASYGGGAGRALVVGTFAGIQYLLADRWYASATLDETERSRHAGDGRTPPSWLLEGRASLSYLVEDSWSLDLLFSHEQEQERNGVFYFPRYFQRTSPTGPLAASTRRGSGSPSTSPRRRSEPPAWPCPRRDRARRARQNCTWSWAMNASARAGLAPLHRRENSSSSRTRFGASSTFVP